MSTYEEVMAKLTDEEITIINEHNQGLLNSVKATRDERDALDKQLKQLSKTVEVGSDAEKQISEMRNKLAGETKRANFFESATKQGVKNAKVAYALASSENLFLEDGNPDWDKIKESVPEIFSAQSTKTDAGSGTNQRPLTDSNKSIRDTLKTSGTIKVKV